MLIIDLENDRKLKFSKYTHFTHIKTIFEYCHACVISEIHVTLAFFIFILGILYLRLRTCSAVAIYIFIRDGNEKEFDG